MKKHKNVQNKPNKSTELLLPPTTRSNYKAVEKEARSAAAAQAQIRALTQAVIAELQGRKTEVAADGAHTAQEQMPKQVQEQPVEPVSFRASSGADAVSAAADIKNTIVNSTLQETAPRLSPSVTISRNAENTGNFKANILPTAADFTAETALNIAGEQTATAPLPLFQSGLDFLTNSAAKHDNSAADATIVKHMDKAAAYKFLQPYLQQPQPEKKAKSEKDAAELQQQQTKQRIFAQAQADLLLFVNEQQAKRTAKPAANGKWQKAWDNLATAVFRNIKEHTNSSEHQYSALLLTMTACLLPAFIFWNLLPGSFLNIYKTQLSGYVLLSMYRSLTVIILPLLIFLHRHTLAPEWRNAVSGQKINVPAIRFFLPLIALTAACLLNAVNRLLVLNLFLPWKRNITEIPFLIKSAGNLQSLILIFLSNCLIAGTLESIFFAGFLFTCLRRTFSLQTAIILATAAWVPLYVAEPDFITLALFFAFLLFFRTVCDNIYVIIVLNILTRTFILFLRQALPFSVTRNIPTYSSAQAMLLVDLLIIAVSSGILYYLSHLMPRIAPQIRQIAGEKNEKKALWLRFSANIAYKRQKGELWESLSKCKPDYKLLVAYLLLWINYLIYWKFL